MNVLYQILILLGTIGLFIYGMKVMSDALQRSSGSRLRRWLSRMTASPGRGIIAGTVITGIIQSSSATTVMIVSFVNAGLLRLRQAIALIMGANIGTTATAWLVALFGFNLDIGMLAIPLMSLVIPMLLVRQPRFREICQIFVGFALLLLAIHILKDAMQALSADQGLLAWMTELQHHGWSSPLLYAAIGTALTCLLQSSSAVMALTLVLCAGGTLPFDGGLAMVLGENLGTTLTALIASSITNDEARRAALSHCLFNLFGLLWALPLLGPVQEGIASLIVYFGGTSPMISPVDQPLGLALFHTLFNVINTLLLVGFIPQMATLTRRLLPNRKTSSALRFVKGSLFSTGEISIYQAQREVGRSIRQSAALFTTMRNYFGEINPEKASTLAAEINIQKQDTLQVRARFERFFASFARETVSRPTEYIAQRLLYLASEMRNADECVFTLTGIIRRKREENIWFDSQARTDIFSLFTHLTPLYTELAEILEKDKLYSSNPSDTERTIQRIYTLYRQIEEKIRICRSRSMNPDPSEEISDRARIVFTEMLDSIDTLARTLFKATEGTFNPTDPSHQSPLHERS